MGPYGQPTSTPVAAEVRHGRVSWGKRIRSVRADSRTAVRTLSSKYRSVNGCLGDLRNGSVLGLDGPVAARSFPTSHASIRLRTYFYLLLCMEILSYLLASICVEPLGAIEVKYEYRYWIVPLPAAVQLWIVLGSW